MDFFVMISYDLHNADSDCYKHFKDSLQDIGLNDFLTDKAKNGPIELPSTTVCGVVSGSGRKSIKNDLKKKVNELFTHCEVSGTSFMTVAETCSVVLRRYNRRND